MALSWQQDAPANGKVPGARPTRSVDMASIEPTPVTTQQLSDLHAHLVEVFGQGIDPARVREAVEASGFKWDGGLPCESTLLYPDGRVMVTCEGVTGHKEFHHSGDRRWGGRPVDEPTVEARGDES